MRFVESINTNSKEVIQVDDSAIVVFVGANNVGKSRCLKDVSALIENPSFPTTVINSVTLQPPSSEEIVETITATCGVSDDQGDYKTYQTVGFHWRGNVNRISGLPDRLGSFKNLFVSFAPTEKRLTSAIAPEAIGRNAPKEHPAHYAAYEPSYKKRLDESFFRAFGDHITPNTQHGRTLPLCIGEPIKLADEYDDEYARQEAYAKILESYPMAHEQGDGIRSFVGLTLELMMNRYRLFLLDEPEAFLHPPQAKIMGEVIADMTKDSAQVFIATHSKDLIQGLISTAPERVKVIRVSRSGNTNSFQTISNETLNKIWSDPILRYSDILDCMFYKSAVICESDSDCMMYSAILSTINQPAYREVKFIYSGGKSRLKDLAEILKSLHVPFIVVPDLDILNNEQTFRTLVESCGGDWSQIEKSYRILANQIQGAGPAPVKRADILTMINANSTPELSSIDQKKIREAVKRKSPWDAIKRHGITGIPSGDAMTAFESVKNYCETTLGIYLVPCGEIENFVKAGTGHGASWVNSVLEKFPDLEDGHYAAITKFVSGWSLCG